MNPSFKPPPPISNKTRNEIYARYMSNPEKFNIRVLSAAYGISFKRIDAILRLQGMEESWKKVSHRVSCLAHRRRWDSMMSKNRLVLKTINMVKTFYMHGFLILCHIHLLFFDFYTDVAL